MFLSHNQKIGLLFAFSFILALVGSNFQTTSSLYSFLSFSKEVVIKDVNLPVGFIINQVLMVMFFLKISMEAKYAFIKNTTSTKEISLPMFAALGGMVVPSIFFYTINYPCTQGFMIPTATDIVLTISVLAAIKNSFSQQAQLFLLIITAFDDIIAALITIFLKYGDALFFVKLLIIVFVTTVMSSAKNNFILHLYFFIVCYCFYYVFKEGYPITMLGLITGLCTPNKYYIKSTLIRGFYKKLHAGTLYFLVPTFILANSGVTLNSRIYDYFSSSIFQGVFLGLSLGKPIGIVMFSWIALKARFALLNKNLKFSEISRLSILCGIGFTMSIFIASISFQNQLAYEAAKAGVLFALVISVSIGLLVEFIRYLLLRNKYLNAFKV